MDKSEKKFESLSKAIECDGLLAHSQSPIIACDVTAHPSEDNDTAYEVNQSCSADDSQHQSRHTKNEEEGNIVERASNDCDSYHAFGSTCTTKNILNSQNRSSDSIADSSEDEELFKVEPSARPVGFDAALHHQRPVQSNELVSSSRGLVDTVVNNISDHIGLQLSLLCSASAYSDLSNGGESLHDGHTALLSSSSSASVEHVHRSPLLTDSFSDEMTCSLLAPAMDKGYCSDEICYSVFSDCVDQIDISSSDMEATLIAFDGENIGSSSSTLRAIRQPLLPLDGSQVDSSCSMRNDFASATDCMVINEPKFTETCLVSQWLSSISGCPDEVPSVTEYCAVKSDSNDVAYRSSSSEQLNSSISANAILLSLGETLRDLQIKMSYCDTNRSGIGLNSDEDNKLCQSLSNPIDPTIISANEAVQTAEPVRTSEPVSLGVLKPEPMSSSALTSEPMSSGLLTPKPISSSALVSDPESSENTNSASHSLSSSNKNTLTSQYQNVPFRESSGEFYEAAAEEIAPATDNLCIDNEIEKRVSNYQQSNLHEQKGPDDKICNEAVCLHISNQCGSVSDRSSVKSGNSSCQKPCIPESRISLENIKISKIKEDGIPAGPAATLRLDRNIKRAYRVGLNIFNIKSDVGIGYLIEKKFVDPQPDAIAKFLLTRKGLSRKAIGEYLSNKRILNNSLILRYFSGSIDLAGMRIDNALRKFLSYFLPPGESQKIEQLMEVFARRYSECNGAFVKQFKGGSETIFLLSFAIVLLNTDLHHRCVKANSKMSVNDFIRNLRGIDDGANISQSLLENIYESIKGSEFRPDTDHMSRVLMLDSMLLSNPKMVLPLPHRRLVSYCQVVEIQDPRRKQRAHSKRRDLFLFNDLLLVTKYVQRKKQPGTYIFRQAIPLSDVAVYLFNTAFYPYGFRLYSARDFDILLTACTTTEYDRNKLISDLHESIMEWDETQSALRHYGLKQNNKSLNISRNNNSHVESVEASGKTSDRKQKSTSLVETAANHRRDLGYLELQHTSFRINFPMGSRQSLDSGLISSRSESTSSCQDNTQQRSFLQAS